MENKMIQGNPEPPEAYRGHKYNRYSYIIFFIFTLVILLSPSALPVSAADSLESEEDENSGDLLARFKDGEISNNPTDACPSDCTTISRFKECGLTEKDVKKHWKNPMFEGPDDSPGKFYKVVVAQFGISESQYRQHFLADVRLKLNVATAHIWRDDPGLAKLLDWVSKIVFVYSWPDPGPGSAHFRPALDGFPNGAIIIGLKEKFSVQELMNILRNELFHALTTKMNRKNRTSVSSAYLTEPAALKVGNAIKTGALRLTYLFNLSDKPDVSKLEKNLLSHLKLHLKCQAPYRLTGTFSSQTHHRALKSSKSSFSPKKIEGILQLPAGFFPTPEKTILDETRLRVRFKRLNPSSYQYTFLHSNKTASIEAQWLLGVLLRLLMYKNFGLHDLNEKVVSEQASDVFSLVPPSLRKILFPEFLDNISRLSGEDFFERDELSDRRLEL